MMQKIDRKSFQNSAFNDFLYATFLSWNIISVLVLCIIIAPFILVDELIYSITPECISMKSMGIRCILCGMTHAFVAISRGNISLAFMHNQYSVILYG
ncbi:MAG: DUF2752 domain-containing protein, partial [Candidatus Kapaibacteriota bacterium]